MYITHSRTRSHEILEAVILAYTESGSPVGSEFLRQRYHLGVSPATIRNAMAELEAQGLITHPHTSAGRIPTDLGYRYYVDLLMQPRPPYREEEVVLRGLEQARMEEPMSLLLLAARRLSQLSQGAGVVRVPQLSQGSFQHLEFIALQPREVVGVLISSEGMVRHARLSMETPVDPEELIRLMRFLNRELSGMPLGQVNDYLQQCFLEAEDEFFFLYKRIQALFSWDALLSEESTVLLEGAERLLEKPDFQNLDRMRRLIRALENRQELAALLQRDLSADSVKVHIGSENRGTHLTDCSVVVAPFRHRGGMRGALGVLGPTRMDYPRVTGLVSRIAQTVSGLLQEH